MGMEARLKMCKQFIKNLLSIFAFFFSTPQQKCKTIMYSKYICK